MQKQQILTLGIVLIIGLIGGVYLIIDPDIGGNDTGEGGDGPIVETAEAKKIKDEIISLENKPWNKSKYQDLISRINISYTNALINDDEKRSLSDFLEGTYVETVNQAAKVFFKSARTEDELGSIYRELKQFQNGTYGNKVKEMIGSCRSYYTLKEFIKETSEFDYNYDGGEATVANYFRQFDDFSSKKYFRNSTLVQSKIKSAKGSLRSKLSTILINEMQSKIINYTKFEKFVSETTNDFKNQLTALEQNSLLNNSSKISAFITRANSDLNAHQAVDNKMKNLKFNPNSCEDICGGHLYYLNLCNDERDSENEKNINPTDTLGY